MYAQLQVNQQNAVNLVNNVFVQQNSGVTVSNIQFTGAPQSIGFFNGQNSNIGLASGIIMTTGSLGIAVGPNNKPDAGDDNNRPGYGPLSNIVGNQTFNASVLTFNFVSESDVVEFRYVFGSEEYPEYVGSQYNDVFAFFISGPGISGNQNIALIPGTNQPVTINNVNAGSFAQFFVNNGDGVTSGGATVQYDGFTRPLTARANVIPCQTYVLTMAIADVKDAFFDSGVFLEASSFTGTEVNIEREISTNPESNELVEDCGKAKIKVSRTGSTNQALTVWLQYSGNATYGVDYTAAPISVTIPANQSAVTFEIEAFEDNLVEGSESVIITYRDTGCTGIESKVVSFFIIDQPPRVSVDLGPDIEIECPGETVQLNASFAGGVQPLSFEWSTGATTQSISVKPQMTSTYTIAVKDVCNKPPVYDTINVILSNYEPLVAEITSDTLICLGESVTLGGVVSGGKGALTYFWQHDGSNSPFVTVQPITNTTYTLLITDECNILVTKKVLVTVMDVKAIFSLTYLSNNTIKFNDLSYENLVSWNWDFGDNIGTSDLQHPTYTYQDTGTYLVKLIVENQAGCKASIVNPVKSYPPFSLYIPNAFTPNGDGLNDRFKAIGEGFVTYEMEIFNRWGESIFFTDQYSIPWGLEDRKLLEDFPIEVYVYKIKVGLPTGDLKEFIGRITLIQ
jgi:gliding motility-associated-like protein